MSLQILFWVLMIVSAVFGLWSSWPVKDGIKGFGSTLLVFILFAIVGWRVFGPAVHN